MKPSPDSMSRAELTREMRQLLGSRSGRTWAWIFVGGIHARDISFICDSGDVLFNIDSDEVLHELPVLRELVSMERRERVRLTRPIPTAKIGSRREILRNLEPAGS